MQCVPDFADWIRTLYLIIAKRAQILEYLMIHVIEVFADMKV